MSYIKETKAQISAEMIIVLAALLAVAIILISKMSKSSKDMGQKIDDQTNNLMNEINDLNA